MANSSTTVKKATSQVKKVAHTAAKPKAAPTKTAKK
jgi:hypothetical protein